MRLLLLYKFLGQFFSSHGMHALVGGSTYSHFWLGHVFERECIRAWLEHIS